MQPTRHQHILITETRPPADWIVAAGVMLLVTILSVLLVPTGSARAEDAAPAGQSSDEMGIKVAAWAVTVPYIIAKGAFAAGGAVVGTLGYLFSGLSYNTANAVWAPSIKGTYIIRPEHLRGDEAVRFVGDGHEPQHESTPVSDQAPSPSVTPDTVAPDTVAPEQK